MAYITQEGQSVKKVTTLSNSNDSSNCNCSENCNCHERSLFSMKKVLLLLLLLLILGTLSYYLYKNLNN